jgi:hypothetical protein
MKLDRIEPDGRALLLKAILFGFQGSEFFSDRRFQPLDLRSDRV